MDITLPCEQYNVKRIEFFGRQTPILCQNENGPCPLIAVANILLLRNHLEIARDITTVSLPLLVKEIGALIIRFNDKYTKDPTLGLNYQQNIEEALKLLPDLNTGLNVNCRFSAANAFEYTQGLTFFDLLDVHLFHGWVVSPQDDETFPVLHSLSYNQLVERLIVYRELCDNIDDIVRQRTDIDDDLRATIQLHAGLRRCDDESSSCPADAGSSHRRTTNSPCASKPSLRANTVRRTKSEPWGANRGNEVSGNLRRESSWHMCRKAIHQTPSNKVDDRPPPERFKNISLAEIRSLLHEGQALQTFVTENASQLTVEGLIQIHDSLAEKEFGVLFRNNHFCTLYKFEHNLYALASDIGFSNMFDIVWERLDQVDGNTMYCDSRFRSAGERQDMRTKLVRAPGPDRVASLARQPHDPTYNRPAKTPKPEKRKKCNIM